MSFDQEFFFGLNKKKKRANCSFNAGVARASGGNRRHMKRVRRTLTLLTRETKPSDMRRARKRFSVFVFLGRLTADVVGREKS